MTNSGTCNAEMVRFINKRFNFNLIGGYCSQWSETTSWYTFRLTKRNTVPNSFALTRIFTLLVPRIQQWMGRVRRANSFAGLSMSTHCRCMVNIAPSWLCNYQPFHSMMHGRPLPHGSHIMKLRSGNDEHQHSLTIQGPAKKSALQ